MRLLFAGLLLLATPLLPAQPAPVVSSLWEGTLVAGYVHRGGFLNAVGPNIQWQQGPWRLQLGMLPSLRIQREEGTPRQALLTPALGVGLTLSYRAAVLQIPFYYQNKSAVHNGQWHPGIGLGWRLRPSKPR